jgi:phospholipid/cholesterol/gamma-HCH transport system substrate-binding protein
VELRYRREAAVGVLIVVGATLFVLLMMWLRGIQFREGELVHVLFDDVAGLKVGDPVRTSGVTVGAVTEIRLVVPGAVSVVLDVKRGPLPRADAVAIIKPLDFFGARFVEYLPGRAATQLASTDTMRGTRARDLIEMAAGLGDPAQALLGNASELVSPTTTRELREVLVEARRALQTISGAGAGPSRQLTEALGELRRVFQRMDIIMADNQQQATEAVRNMREASASLSEVTRTLTHTTATLDSLLTRVNRGSGTVGALLNDSTLYHELRRTNNALAELLLDMRANPGRYIRLRF